MKIRTISTLLAFFLLAVFLLAGCGGSSTGADNTGSTGGVGETKAEEPSEPVPEVVEQVIAEQITEAADTEAEPDAFVGEWAGVDDESLFAKITKEGERYIYEDNDGAYEAVLSEGILKITVSEDDYADVYVDKETGNLVLTYMDSIITYTRK